MAWVNRLTGLLGGNHINTNIVIVGLPNSGKSTLMHQLKPPQVKMRYLQPVLPLPCKDAAKFELKAFRFVAFDPSDLSGFGNPYEDFYRDCHGLIFLIDSTDRVNMQSVRVEFGKVLANPLLSCRQVPLLVLANKMDQPGAVASFQLSSMLDLKTMTKNPCFVCSTDALTGEGLHEGFDWLAHELRRLRKR